MANPYYVKYGIKFKITKKYEVKFISSVKKIVNLYMKINISRQKYSNIKTVLY